MGHRQRVRRVVETTALFVDNGFLFGVHDLFGSNWENIGSVFVIRFGVLTSGSVMPSCQS
jgi:hypothetical protein